MLHCILNDGPVVKGQLRQLVQRKPFRPSGIVPGPQAASHRLQQKDHGNGVAPGVPLRVGIDAQQALNPGLQSRFLLHFPHHRRLHRLPVFYKSPGQGPSPREGLPTPLNEQHLTLADDYAVHGKARITHSGQWPRGIKKAWVENPNNGRAICYAMRILHLADTHLGYSAYHKTADNGLNQREVDVYDAFRRAVDYALHHKPDLVVHAGDLFDTVRPTNRALNVALRELLRLSRAGIPTVIISGNHETPKLRETGSVFRIFEHLDHIYPVYQGQYETLEFGEITVHAIPHCPTGEGLQHNLESVTPVEDRFNLLLLHVGVSGIREFRTGDFNEQVIPTGYLAPHFDYIALGHYHRQTKVTDNAYYAGSTEHLSFKEAGEKKGVMEIDTRGPDVSFVPLPVRPMLDLGTLDCSSLSAEEITRQVVHRLQEKDIEGAVVRILLQSIPRSTYKGLDFPALRQAAGPALHFELSHQLKELEQELVSRGRIGSLTEEWKHYLSQVVVEEDKEELEALALHYLTEVEE